MSEAIMAEAQQQPDNKFAIPVRYGLMTGFILMFLSTVNFLYILKVNFLAFGLFALLTSLIPIIFYVIVISKQRKMMGGYITIKEAFQGVFIVILISQIIGAIYGVIYFKYIDPECVDRMKEAALSFFTKMNAPKAQIDKQIADFDKQLADSKSAGALIYATAKYIVIQSILGFICALIMKKERPQQFQ